MEFIHSFSGITVDDLAAAKVFYVTALGLEVANEQMGLTLNLPGGGQLFIYSKDEHKPADYTVLSFVVADIDAAVDQLTARGITFERYDLGNGAAQDDKGVLRGLSVNMGPNIAWFKDPAGNVLSILQIS